MPTMKEIMGLVAKKGAAQYGSEPVSQLEHALQSAWLAEEAGSSPALITAALLHDIGHLVDKKFQLGQDEEIDRHHEDIGEAFLRTVFPPSVTEPIRLHVPAKRYLCHADSTYFDGLSPASVRSLNLQGGVFSGLEATDFINLPYADDAVSLRRWDDLAKVPGKATPPLSHFETYVEKCLSGRTGRDVV